MTRPVVIVGAGVAGCVAARTLADLGQEVVLVEAGPGSPRPPQLDAIDHLSSSGGPEAAEWWYADLPKRGRGLGGSSAVNGMVLDAIHPLDIKRWGWDDAQEHQRWLLDRWTHTVAPPPVGLTEAFGRCAQEGFPTAPSTATPGWSGWAPLALAHDGTSRVSVADAFAIGSGDDIDVRQDTAVVHIAPGGHEVQLSTGETLAASMVLLAAGNAGSPKLLVDSGLIRADDVAEPLNHASTAIVVELEESLQVSGPQSAPSSHMLRTVTGLSENTVDLQMLVLDHTGASDTGRRHGAVIVSALEPDRQKVLIAGITQALRWLHTIEGVVKVSLSEDPCPVQHHACSLAETPLSIPGVHVIDASVLPALPHTNPMMSIAIGARRAALRHGAV